MTLQAPPTKIPKDVLWNAGKNYMGKVDQFLDSLLMFDKENIGGPNMTAITKYLEDKEFDPDLSHWLQLVRTLSLSLSLSLTHYYLYQGLCSWVIN